MENKNSCHKCKWKYSCGYTGCLNGLYTCSQGNSFKKANGVFWSFKEQKEVNEETAKKHFLESEPFGIVKDKGEVV